MRGKPPYFLSTTYWKQPEKWKECFVKEDWFNTGDLAMKEGDGYFHFKGRADDVMSLSGYRVGPAEVEASLMEHSARDRISFRTSQNANRKDHEARVKKNGLKSSWN